MRGWLRRLLGTLAIAVLIAGPLGASAAQDALPDSIQQTLAQAAGQGEDALLQAVRAAVAANPELAQAIVGAAAQLNPELRAEIAAAAAAAGGDVEILTAAGPALGAGPVLAGLGLLGGGAAAAGGGGGSGGGGGAPTASPEPAPDPSPDVDTNPPPDEGSDPPPDEGSNPPPDEGSDSPPDEGSSPPPDEGNDPPPDEGNDPEPTPADFETEEYNAQAGLALINASNAYARGLTGAGIVIALFDTGLDLSHPEFAGRIAAGAYDFVRDTGQVTDPNGHGTHMAGIIAANRDGTGMHGVAYEALLLPLTILDENGLGSLSDGVLVGAIDHAIANGARIFSNSWAPSSGIDQVTAAQLNRAVGVMLDAYRRAVDAGTIVVFAAGNDARAQPSYTAGLPALFGEFAELWVAVVAVDLNGGIPNYSNRCGVAAAWCLAAPGGGVPIASAGIYSTEAGGGYIRGSGTSMAAPHVSGALAILLQLFPELTPQEIVDRLFETADRSGIYANATVFGNGLLDLDAATRPVGAVAILTGDTADGPSDDAAASGVQTSGAFGNALAVSLAGMELTVFDRYRAGFVLDLGTLVRSADTRLDLRRLLRGFGGEPGVETFDFAERGRAIYAYAPLRRENSVPSSAGGGEEKILARLSLIIPQGDAGEVLVGYNDPPALGFGLYGRGGLDRNAVASRDAFRAPHLALAELGYSVGAAMEAGRLGALRVMSFSGRSAENGAEAAFGAAAELSRGMGARAHVSILLGSLLERESFLGSRTAGAFDLDRGTPTYFGGLSAEVTLAPRLTLVGSVYAGLSYPTAAQDSLFTGVSAIETRSFSLGLLSDGVVTQGDRLGLLINQPMRVIRGRAELSLATGRDRAGNVFRRTVSANLAPRGRELDFEAFYRVDLSARTTLTTSAMLRTEPGHVRGADDVGVLLFRLKHRF